MSNKRHISFKEALSIGTRLHLNWADVSLDQFRQGLEIELEHTYASEAKLTTSSLLHTGKIAWAHLKEMRDYYTLLHQLEAAAKSQP